MQVEPAPVKPDSKDSSLHKPSTSNHGAQNSRSNKHRTRQPAVKPNNSKPNNHRVNNATHQRPSTSNPNSSSGHARHHSASAGAAPASEDLNHMLGFRFGRNTDTAERRTFRKPKKFASFKKEVFMHANYHFVLTSKKAENYASLVDPDSLVDWSDVQHVYYPTESATKCPICLDAPVAAKITRCGHIFCGPCILHYLSLGTQNWSRCPLCFEPVYPQALKSFSFQIHRRYRDNETVEMILMTRPKTSCVPFPSNANGFALAPYLTAGRPIPKKVCGDVDDKFDPAIFSRFLVTDDISNILERERSELVVALHAFSEESKDLDNLPYIRLALDAIDVREKDWAESHGQQTPIPLAEAIYRAEGPDRMERERQVKARKGKEDAAKREKEAREQAKARMQQDKDREMNERWNKATDFPTLLAGGSPGGRAGSKPSKKKAIVQLSQVVPPAADRSTTGVKNGSTAVKASPPTTSASSGPKSALSALSATAVEFVPTGSVPPLSLGAAAMPAAASASTTAAEPVHAERANVPVVAKPKTSAFYDADEEAEAQHEANKEYAEALERVEQQEEELTDQPQQEEPDKGKGSDAYHFYQAADGQQLYLHATNFRYLKSEFKTEENLPPRLKVPIVDFSVFIQNDTTRNHFRFLSHLPLTSKFSLAFVDLSTFLSSSNKGDFEKELKEYKDRIRKKAKEVAKEDKRRARAQQYGSSPVPFAYDDTGDGATSFPGLSPINPLGFALPAEPQVSHSPSVSGWSSIADRGFASALHWAPLSGTASAPTSTTAVTASAASASASSSAASASVAVPGSPRPASGSAGSPGGVVSASPLAASSIPAASASNAASASAWNRAVSGDKTPPAKQKGKKATVLFSTSSRMTM